jgi:hypothetical protein
MVVAGIAAIVVAGGTAWWYVTAGTLPEPHKPRYECVFPELDYGAATPGSSVGRVYASFGKQPPQGGTHGETARCVVFGYDPDLFDGALVVLTHGSTIANRWIMKGSTLPSECLTVPKERVSLAEWHAAAVR